MSDMNATDSKKSDEPKPVQPKRLNRKSPMPARGRTYTPRSCRGLVNVVVIDPQCPYCGESHVYRAAGLRIAACRGGYVEIKARKARRPSAAKGAASS